VGDFLHCEQMIVTLVYFTPKLYPRYLNILLFLFLILLRDFIDWKAVIQEGLRT
jgi:hypothetical protein